MDLVGCGAFECEMCDPEALAEGNTELNSDTALKLLITLATKQAPNHDCSGARMSVLERVVSFRLRESRYGLM